MDQDYTVREVLTSCLLIVATVALAFVFVLGLLGIVVWLL